MEHTQGKLSIHKRSATTVVNDDNRVIAACGGYANNQIDPDKLARELEANARRLVACWNACEGIETAHVEELGLMAARIESATVTALKAQRDAFFEAAQEALQELYRVSPSQAAPKLRALIAKHINKEASHG